VRVRFRFAGTHDKNFHVWLENSSCQQSHADHI